MDFTPLTNAPFAIQLHAYAALAAFALGLVQFASVKGATAHRVCGYAWIALMLVVAISAFWIHDIRLWGLWSPIHLLAILTLVMLPVGLYHARRHHIPRHKYTMIGIFAGALMVAGLFTLVPGRIMHQVLFGS